jgi:hypothetical protein
MARKFHTSGKNNLGGEMSAVDSAEQAGYLSKAATQAIGGLIGMMDKSKAKAAYMDEYDRTHQYLREKKSRESAFNRSMVELAYIGQEENFALMDLEDKKMEAKDKLKLNAVMSGTLGGDMKNVVMQMYQRDIVGDIEKMELGRLTSERRAGLLSRIGQMSEVKREPMRNYKPDWVGVLAKTVPGVMDRVFGNAVANVVEKSKEG